MAVTVQINANIQWLAFQDPQTGTWMGLCPALNLNAVGDTWGEFRACADDAMQLLFRDLFKSSELDQFLKLNGWKPDQPLPAVGGEVPRFEIPHDLQRKSRYDELVTADR